MEQIKTDDQPPSRRRWQDRLADAEEGVPPFLRQYPRTACHRRLMPHMLAMAAAKVGHPMTFLILVITDNGLLHNDAPRFFTFPLADAAICTTGLADTCM